MQLMPFRLFHGTSTLFVDKICQTGLGSHNPVSEFNAIECLSHLINEGDQVWRSDEDWTLESYTLRLIAGQTITGANMNFRHGGTYLSPSEATSVRYALSNKTGSECISACIDLANKIRATDASRLSVFEANFPNLSRLCHERFDPIIFFVDDVPIEFLQTENGSKDVLNRISKIQDCQDLTVREILLQQENFELLHPIKSSRLMVFRVVPDGPGPVSVDNYRLAPYEAA